MKKTPWFPCNHLPVRKGVYEVDQPGMFAYWDGKCWASEWLTIESASRYRHYKDSESFYTWRGLAENPK